MQIASGLHRVGSQIVSSYLIAGRDGVTIIDAGLPGYWKLLQAELAAMGKGLGDVRALVLTHGDTDHIGFAARLHRETGVAAYIHQADADRARMKVKKPNSGWGPVKIGPLAGFLWYSARRGGLRPQPATELQTIADGDVLDVPGSPRIIHTPGHTPGSVAVHVGRRRAVPRRHDDHPQRPHRRRRSQAGAVHARASAGCRVPRPGRGRRCHLAVARARAGVGRRRSRGRPVDPRRRCGIPHVTGPCRAGKRQTANRPKSVFTGPFKIRTSAMTCGYYRTSSPVTALPMIMRWISDVPSKIVKILASRCHRSTG
jgi:Metallo-beta-lactamase superfamily